MSADTADIITRKADARRKFATIRANAHSTQIDAADRLSAQLTPLLTGLPEVFFAGQIIAGFWPYRSEIDCRAVLAKCRDFGMITALPITGDDATPLSFGVFSGNEHELIAGRFGIAEPPAHARLVTPDIILSPLLACDVRGYRLGYGGGFYDRTIAGLKEAQHSVYVIGVGYDAQYVRSVPIDEFDQPLDGLLTPSQFIHFDKG